MLEVLHLIGHPPTFHFGEFQQALGQESAFQIQGRFQRAASRVPIGAHGLFNSLRNQPAKLVLGTGSERVATG